jgi:hypothetical protein
VIEKAVKVLYSVTDTTTEQTTFREAFIPALTSSSAPITIASLFSKWSSKNTGIGGKFPSSSGITPGTRPDSTITVPAFDSASYTSANYGSALAAVPGDQYEIAIDGYQVQYQNSAKNWYWDSKPSTGTSTNLSGEKLMFGATGTSTPVPPTSTFQLVQAMAAFGGTAGGITSNSTPQQDLSSHKDFLLAANHHG